MNERMNVHATASTGSSRHNRKVSKEDKLKATSGVSFRRTPAQFVDCGISVQQVQTSVLIEQHSKPCDIPFY